MLARLRLVLTTIIGSSIAVVPGTASADILSAFVAAKAVHVGGSGEVFESFEGPVAAGLEAGIEVLAIDLFGEAMIMGADQYLFTANLGFDFSIGDDLRIDLGVFTGPVFFTYPPAEAKPVFDLGNLSADERTAIQTGAMAAGYGSAEDLGKEFDQFASTESDLDRMAMGWNLGRLRATAQYGFGEIFSIGAVVQIAYHMIISGEDVVAGAKNAAIDQYAADQGLPNELTGLVRQAVGARPVDEDKLGGVNYNVGVFFKIEI